MQSRRKFIRNTTLGSVALVSGLANGNCFSGTQNDRKLGIALVGLGNYATNKIAPAFKETKYCNLTGIVSGTPAKVKDWQSKYKIPTGNCYTYENFDTIKDNPEIDIVYVVLPNSMHAEFTIRAAQAGKHVICEKPMEVSVEKCRNMINACNENNRLLQIGYRCRYDPYHQELMRIGREEVLGKIKVITSEFSFYGVHSDNWRFTDKALSGGGPMMDIGIYCLDATRYVTGEEPVSVTAQSQKTFKDKLPGMEETLFWQMEFPSGAVVNCTTSYVARADFIKVSAEQGNFGLEPAFGYSQPEGYIRDEFMDFGSHIQQATQMDAFARNVLDGTGVAASGEQGLQDMKIITAVYEAMESGEKIYL